MVKSNCYHSKGHDSACNFSSNPYMILFGVIQIFFSQIPDFDQISWLSIVAAIMSFTYSFIGLLLGILQTSENGRFKGSFTGVNIGTGGNGITETQKIWRSFQAFGDIAFAYSYSIILIEIQDTIRSPPSEVKTMKKGCKIGAVTTTLFYMACGCMGYAAFGNDAPGNLLTGFGFYNPYWLIDIANITITVHLIGAYQVFGQPLFAFVENHAKRTWPDSNFVNRDFSFKSTNIKFNLFRLVWRTSFVVLTTVLSMLLPFFNDVVGILGALGFWPLTVYFPVEMYIAQKKIPKWSTYWISLQMLSVACFIVSIAAAAGSIAGVILDLKVYRPF